MTARHSAFLLGRALFGGYFVYNGINHLKNEETMAGYAASKGVPVTHVAVPATAAMLLAGGASVLTGIAPRWGLTSILTFLAGVTPSMHRFWEEENPERRAAETVNFLKNVALAGASLMLLDMPEPWNRELPEGELEIDLSPDVDRLLVA